MATVILDGWRKGLRKVSLNRLLREVAGFSPAQAHEAVDRLLEGKKITVTLPNEPAAEDFSHEADQLGACTHQPEMAVKRK